MQAKLKTNLYDLADNGIHQSNQPDGANALTLDLINVEDLDQLRSDATDCEEITILDGEEEKGVFYDYVNFRGLNVEEDVAHLWLKQDSVVRQVQKLRQTVAEQAQTIAEQEQIITTQAARIEELEASQGVQDEELEMQGDAILEMSEIVYA